MKLVCMVDVTSFEEAYEYLEKNALEHRHIHELGRIFEPLIEKYRVEADVANEKMAHNEREAFFFRVIDSELSPMMTFQDQEGNEISYPDISKFDKDSLDYFEKRLGETNNLIVKARYALILWNSPKKHAKYADIAIDTLLELSDIYKDLDSKHPDKNYGLEVVDSLKGAYILARSIKHAKIEEISDLIIETIKNYDWESGNSFAVRRYLLEFILDSKFDAVKFDSMTAVCEKLAEKHEGHQKIMIFDLAKRVATKFGLDEKPWIRKIAEEYEKMMTASIENNALVADNFWQEAYQHYQIIRDKSKLVELLKTRDEIKKSSKVEEIQTVVNMEQIEPVINEISDKLSEMGEIDAIKILIADEGLLPEVAVIKKKLRKFLNNIL